MASPAAGREKAAFAGRIGYFVNPIVIRTHVSRDLSFAAFLDQVRLTVLNAFEHQHYPFAKLVEDLQPSRDQSRPPLFQAMFILQKSHLLDGQGLSAFALGEAGASVQLNGLTLESMALKHRIAEFDLTLAMAEAGIEMAASLEYNSDLFDRATIERLAKHLQTLLGGIVAAPSTRVSELPLLDEAERRLLSEWNRTRVEFPTEHCLHELIEEQVKRSPEAIAVVFEQERLTYADLNERAMSWPITCGSSECGRK